MFANIFFDERSVPYWTETQKLTASDGAANDRFGYSVAISADGLTIAIGTIYDDIGATSNQGSVYLFTKSGGTWTETQKLTASDGAADDNFGHSVAISADGSRIICGVEYDITDGSNNPGSAYVFTKSGGTWTETQKLTASDGAAYDDFGTSVGISSDGTTIIVGARLDDISATSNQGSAYVFTESGGTWTQTQKLTASDGAANDFFGTSVGISSDGTTIIVGATDDDVSANSNQGSAYVFTKSGGTWTQTQKLTASDGAANDRFGTSVGISSDGTTIIVGAYGADVGSNSNQGSAYVFTKSGGTWTQTQKLTASDGAASDLFGQRLDISSDGGVIICGTDNKRVYTFKKSGASWTQYQKIRSNDSSTFDGGVSVSDDGVTVAFGWTSNNGSAYVFDYTTLSY